MRLLGDGPTASTLPALAALRSTLTRLIIADAAAFPTGLGQLTGLHELQLRGACSTTNSNQANAALDAALQQLTQLTGLYLSSTPLGGGVPLALAGLDRLQRCHLSGLGAGASLPAGPWLASIRELGASLVCVMNSGATLAAAAQLTRLALADVPSQDTGPLINMHAAHKFWSTSLPGLS